MDRNPATKNFLENGRERQKLVDEGKAVWVDVGTQSGKAYVEAHTLAVDRAFGSDLAAALGVEKAGDAMVVSWKQQQSKISKAVSLVVKGAFGSDIAAGIYGRRMGNLAGQSVAQGILSKREAVDQAWQSLLDAIKNSQSVTAQTARLTGQLASKALIKGLHDPDPAVRAQARYTKQLIIDQLEELRPRAGTLSKQAWANLRKAMKSADPDIARAATDIYNAAIAGKGGTGPSSLPAQGTSYGKAFGHNLAAGLASKQHEVEVAASKLAGAAGLYLKISSPAKKGPWSELGGPEGWGKRFAASLTKGIVGGVQVLDQALGLALSVPTLGQAVPSMGLPSGMTSARGLATVGAGVVNNYYNTANVQGAPAAHDPLGVARELGRAARNGLFRPGHVALKPT